MRPKDLDVKFAYLFHWIVLGQLIVILAEKTWAGPFAPNAVTALVSAQIFMLISTMFTDKYRNTPDSKYAHKSCVLQMLATACVPIALVLAKDSGADKWHRSGIVLCLLSVCACARAFIVLDADDQDSNHWFGFRADSVRATALYAALQGIEIVLVFFDHKITKDDMAKSIDGSTLLVGDIEKIPNQDGSLPDAYKYLWPITIVYIVFAVISCAVIAKEKGDNRRLTSLSASVWVLSAVALVMVYTNYNKREVEEGSSVLAVIGGLIVAWSAFTKWESNSDTTSPTSTGSQPPRSSFTDLKRARYERIIAGF